MPDWPSGLNKFVFDEIDSTNKEPLRRVAHAPAWILSHVQTAGVGRRGRGWSTTKGNFAATYITPTKVDIAKIALRTFVASLALYDALVAVGVRASDLSLKWPNDVLLKDGKLAGILLETTRLDGQSYMLIGIGVNLAQLPEQAKIQADATAPRSLATDADIELDAETFLSALAPAFAAREQQMQQHGFGAIRADWLALAARIGQRITARMPSGDVTGIFTTLDDTGAVILETPSGARAIHAADIFFE